MAGIYVHIPFCASFCTYCGFYSELCPAGGHTRYIEALRREIALRRSFFTPADRVRTLYFGGGTPSLLTRGELGAVCAALRENFDLCALEEFTIEVNPEDIVQQPHLAAFYRECGADRISMGVQSFCDSHLKWMNRRHSAAQAREAFGILRSAGFENISIDLIFGYGGLTAQQWKYNLREAVALAPEHISAYQMSIDDGSALGRLAENGRYSEPDEELCAQQYALLQDTLEAAGYLQYEISNFARPGFYSRHNSAYWAREPYLGLGAAAHSFNGSDFRSWNPDSVERYCAALEGGSLPSEGSERLGEREIYNERVMLGLRTVRGVEKGLVPAGGVLQEAGERLRIPRSKLFICDSIIESFLK